MQIESKCRESLNGLLQKGVTYADVRVHLVDKRQSIGTMCGSLDSQSVSEEQGVGVRVLFQGAWGFASSHSKEDVDWVANKALENAKSAAKLSAYPICLLPKPIIVDNYRDPSEIDPFSVPLADKVSFFLDLDKQIKREGLAYWGASGSFYKKEVLYMDTEGSFIRKELVDVDGHLYAFANDREGRSLRRSHNLFYDAQATTGWETFLNPQLFSRFAPIISEELLTLASAPQCEKMTADLLILNNQMALQTHETIGHPLELDRILGYEMSYAGGSFIGLEDFNSLQYGADKLTVQANGVIRNSPGSFGFDDDGVAAQNVVLIEQGVLRNALTSRQMAAEANNRLGRTLFAKSGGTSRASSYNRTPLERMTNINIMSGNDGSLEDIISKMEKGLMLDNPVSWSIGSNRENFHFACEIGWLIKDGRIEKMVKNPAYSGDTLPFWRSLSKVGSQETWKMEVVYNCGKGQPNQIMRLGHGVPVCLFTDVSIG